MNETPDRAGGFYRIIMEGGRQANWDDFMTQVSIETRESGGHQLTVITGRVADQSALYGIVASACDLGLVLVAIEPLED